MRLKGAIQMEPIKLFLDEKYKKLVTEIRRCVTVYEDECLDFYRSNNSEIRALGELWFGTYQRGNDFKAVERIHSVDEIEWIEHKYKWRLKNKKFFERFMYVDESERISFTSSGELLTKYDLMTESYLKDVLADTGLSFEAFERVNDDDK